MSATNKLTIIERNNQYDIELIEIAITDAVTMGKFGCTINIEITHDIQYYLVNLKYTIIEYANDKTKFTINW